MKIAVYPGSFDPITIGHLDIIKRAAKIFDKVVILIAVNPNKKYRFSVEERKEAILDSTKEIPNVEVDTFNGLTIDYANKIGARFIIRGLRVVSDFEYEWSYAAANEYIDSNIEMVFLMAHKELSFISSSTINEMFDNGVDITPLVPNKVLELYKKK